MPPLETKAAEGHLSAFLSALFHTFEREGVDYAVARDYESLPRTLGGRDLDILVKESEFERAYRALVVIAASLSAKVFKIDQEADTYALVFVTRSDPPLWGVHVDFLRPQCASWRGCCFVDATAAMERKVRRGGISTLSEDDIVFMQLCRDIIGSLHLREKYRKPIRNIYFADPRKFRTKLANKFGQRSANQLVELCREERFDRLAPLGKRLRRGLLLRALLGQPIKTAKDMHRYLAWRCREYLRPNGIMVAVLGPDGSDKGTLIEKAQDQIYKLTRSRPRVYHRRPGLLPGLDQKPKGTILSTLRLAYYTLDYVLGYWLLVRPYLGRKCIAAIFDGYFYDYFIDQRRLWGSPPSWAVKFLNVFIPKPDITIVLSPEPRTGSGREAALEKAERQTHDMPRLVRHIYNAVRIRASGPNGRSVQDIVRVILEGLGRHLGESSYIDRGE